MYLLKWNGSSREYENYGEARERMEVLLKEGHKKVRMFKLHMTINNEGAQLERIHYTGL